MMRVSYYFLIVASLMGSAAFAQERAPDNRWWAWLATPDAQSVQRGKAVYVASCGSCHAANATGTAKGPNLIRSGVVRHDKDGSAIAALVRSGVPAKGMPPIEMSDTQIGDVVSFIRQAVQTYDNPSAGPLPADYPAQDLLTGNAQAGKAFFDGAGGCSGCHSATGDLAGIASKYNAGQLEARFMMPRTTKPRTATVTTSSGEKITGVLLVINNYDVSVRLPDGTAQSWPAETVKVEIQDPLEARRELLDKYTDADMHNMLAYLWTLK
jgi:cytochrome c oxidase cbb3-type subunit 3